MKRIYHPPQNCGLTLIELLVIVAIMSIITTIGVPSLNAMTDRSTIRKEVSIMKRAMAIARSGAIDHSQSTVICPLNNAGRCNDKWEDKITVFLDADGNQKLENQDQIIYTLSQIPPNVTERQFNRGAAIIFRHDGSAFGSNGTLSVCINAERTFSGAVILSGTGRLREAPDINNDGIAEGAAGVNVDCHKR